MITLLWLMEQNGITEKFQGVLHNITAISTGSLQLDPPSCEIKTFHRVSEFNIPTLLIH